MAAALHGTQNYKQLLNSIAKDLDCMLHDLNEPIHQQHHHDRRPSSLPTTTKKSSSSVSGRSGTKVSSYTAGATSGGGGGGISSPRFGDLPQYVVPRLAATESPPPPAPGHHHHGEDLGMAAPSSVASVRVPAAPSETGGGKEDSGHHGGGIDPVAASWDVADATDHTGGVDSLYGQPCSISLLERLILTHPVWFLRGIYRAGAVHLLQGKEIGNFIIRQSSQSNTMAITVRLPEDKGPYIEHYLIEAIGNKLRLEGSDNHFTAIPVLVAHYCQCCDELPVQLTLPRSIAETLTKQELSSLALLGQEFWGSSLASSSPSSSSSSSSPPKPFRPLPGESCERPSMTTFGSPATSPPAMSTFKDGGGSSSSSSLSPTKKRPAPPPRWYSISPTLVTMDDSATPTTTTTTTAATANFTVTTTVTFHMNQCTATLPIQVVETCKLEGDEEGEKKELEVPPQPILTTATTATLTRKSQEPQQRPRPPPPPPCIESPPGYHCSSVADKVSDYEDIWMRSPSPPSSQKQTTTSEELEVVKALKALGLTGSQDVAKEQEKRWNCSMTNQTDQEKVVLLSRNSHESQRRSRLGLDLPLPLPPFPRESADFSSSSSMKSPFYSEPVDALHKHLPELRRRILCHRHSEPSIVWRTKLPPKSQPEEDADEVATASTSVESSSLSSGSWRRVRPLLPSIRPQLSSSLTDLRRPNDGGVVNIGFSCSSTQLLTSEATSTLGRRHNGGGSSSEVPGFATLPRARPSSSSATAAATTTRKSLSLLQQRFFADTEACSAATTLTRKHGGGKSFVNNEMSWRLDSSWEWCSRHGGGVHSSLPSDDTDSSSEEDEEDFVVEDLDDELNLVQTRVKGSRFPMMLRRPQGTYVSNSFLDSSADTSAAATTIEELLMQKQPQLKIPEIKPLTASNLLRVSEYDNLGSDEEDFRGTKVVVVVDEQQHRATRLSRSVPSVRPPPLPQASEAIEVRARHFLQPNRLSHQSPQRKVPSEAGSSATEFSEPWDSSRWEQLLMQAATDNNNRLVSSSTTAVIDSSLQQNGSIDERFLERTSDVVATELIENDLNGTVEAVRKSLDTPSEDILIAAFNGDSDTVSTLSTLQNDNDAASFSQFDEGEEDPHKLPVLPCLLSLRRKDRHLGHPIRDYVFKMAQDRKLIFGLHIENFIQCTMESQESDPHVMMRNIRQFMSGMANFLVNSGEGRFSHLVQEERAKLRPNEFLNLDTILEGVLHKIVLKPLKRHLCHLFVREYTTNGAVAMLCNSIKFARTRTPEQLGIKSDLRPLHGHCMEMVKHYLNKLQRAYSPLKKLENLLAAISIIYQSILHDRGGHPQSVGADDFLPMLTYVLVHCGLIAAEIEAEYMWGLLHPSLLPGEGGYYLTTLSSAVHVLKHLQRCHTEGTVPTSDVYGDRARVALRLSELDGFMKVFVPDEQNGNIISKTVPVRPNMTTRDICRMVAHRLSVSNPQDYALYKLVNGEETMLCDTACPWLVKMEMASAGVDCIFAYKRTDAKIAWPVNFKKT